MHTEEKNPARSYGCKYKKITQTYIACVIFGGGNGN